MTATVLRLIALLIFLLGLFYLYVEFEAVRIGAISPLNYLLIIIAVFAIPSTLSRLAKRMTVNSANSDETNA